MGGVTATVVFPSVEWFQRLADLMAEDTDRFRKLGEVDVRFAVNIIDGKDDGTPWCVELTFEELEVTNIREIGVDDLTNVDFVIETDRESWEEMVASITAGDGRPDLDHTLNALSMAGTPMRVWSSDPLGRDAFFRYNQTVQQFVNNCTRISQ